MFIRMLAVILLSALLTATAVSQPVAKDPSKDKETSKEPKWPKEIGKKSLAEWLKIAREDKDAAARADALLTIPNFSPVEVRKECTKALCKRLESGGEPDSGVKLFVMDLIGAIGIEDPGDTKEALRVLNIYASGEHGSVSRMHALKAIAKFGPKAHGLSRGLANSTLVYKDPSFEVRRIVAQTLGQIAKTEALGPDYSVLKSLATNMANANADKESCVLVRLAALESLFILGPPLDLTKPAQKGMPPTIDTKAAEEIIDIVKKRIAGAKPVETNKQAELWSRLVVVRFGTVDDMHEQLNAIAENLTNNDESVKYQTIVTLGFLGENAEPKINQIVAILNSTKTNPQGHTLREAALMTLGSIGEKAIEPIRQVIEDTAEEPEMRIAALKALAMMGEKAGRVRGSVVAIVQDPLTLEEPSKTRIALLEQALLTLAGMGVKAKSEVPSLQTLSKKLVAVKEKRMRGEEYQKWLKSPETQRWLKSMKKEEADEILNNQNPEDQLKRFIDDAVVYINKSEEGHPGGAPKK